MDRKGSEGTGPWNSLENAHVGNADCHCRRGCCELKETSLKMGKYQGWLVEAGVAGRSMGEVDHPDHYLRRTCGLAIRKAVRSPLSGVGLSRTASAAESQQALQGPPSATDKGNNIKASQCQACPTYYFNPKDPHRLSQAVASLTDRLFCNKAGLPEKRLQRWSSVARTAQ